MKYRHLILSLVILPILLAGLVLASDISLSVGTLSQATNSTTLTITNNNATQSHTVAIQTPINITDNSGNSIQIQPSSTQVSVGNQSSQDITLSITSFPSDFDLGTFSTSILAYVVGDQSNNITTTLSFRESFCEEGNVGNDLEIVRVKDLSSDNDWEWKPLDKVEIEVKVKNLADEDLDVIIELALYNHDTGDFIELDEDEAKKSTSIDEDDSVVETFEIEVPVEDIEDKDYLLYVKAYEEDEEDTRCIDNWDGDYYQEVKVDKKSREVVIKNINYEDTVSCGETLEISTKAYNIGKNDEKRVYFNLYNKELGVNLDSDYFKLNEGDSKTVYFDISVPSNATEKTYSLELKAFYDYSTSNDDYDEISDIYLVKPKVDGNCIKPVTKAVQITAVLESEEAIAGEEIVIKATLKNTGSETTTYSIFVTGNEEWSVLEKIDPSAVTIQKDQSQDVLIHLKADEDAEGENTLTVKVIYSGEIKEQPVSVIIEPSSSLSWSFDSLGENFKSNWLIWVIVVINIILIVAIILVAIKLSK